MVDAVGLWVIVYYCVTSVNTKDMIGIPIHVKECRQTLLLLVYSM